MKSADRNSWSSVLLRPWKNISTKGCCISLEIESEELRPGRTPVYLNVYDLTPVNDCLYWAGIGLFHSGIEVHGTEYGFGAHEFPEGGIFETEPHSCPGFKFRRSILMGTTSLDGEQVRDLMSFNSEKYHGDTYHMIYKNCNHFSADLCQKLTGKLIPNWVNRLAKIGSKFSPVLPKSIKDTKVCHNADARDYTCETKGVNTLFS